MNPIAWLELRVPGFAALSDEERTAIQQFVEAINGAGNARTVWRTAGRPIEGAPQVALEFVEVRGQPAQVYLGRLHG